MKPDMGQAVWTAPSSAMSRMATLRSRIDVSRVLLSAAGVLVLAFLLLPSVMVFGMSFGAEKYLQFPPGSWSLRWYVAYLTDPEWIRPTLFSLRIALLTTLLSTIVGTMGALALVRGSIPGREWVNAAIAAPIAAPTIVIAIAIYLLLAPLHLVGTAVGFVLAHSVLAVPYVVMTVSASLYRLDPSLELAALSLGASRVIAARLVILPLIMPGVLTGAAFAFTASFDEAVVSFFISGVTTDKTLPKKLFEDIDFDVSPIVAAVSTLLTLVSLLVMGSAQWIRPRAARRREHVLQSEGATRAKS